MPETRRKCAGGMVCELVTRFSLWGVPFYLDMKKDVKNTLLIVEGIIKRIETEIIMTAKTGQTIQHIELVYLFGKLATIAKIEREIRKLWE